ncbi:hypothetical protein GFJ99_11745 [Flavobacterium sp. LMO6]|nr:hypothetical protein [Flavobacterium sp. LMO6]
MKKSRLNRFIYQVSPEEWEEGKQFMLSELHPYRWNSPIRKILWKAIADFEAGKFSYDGATFVKERSSSLFEVAAFLHDWRNAMGYVSYQVDREMLDVMITLDYNLNLIKWRWFLTRFTFLNIIRHRIMFTYVSKKPSDLYKLVDY